MIALLGVVVACSGSSDRPGAVDGPGSDTLDAETSDTDTVDSEDTDPPCYPSPEIVGDGIDQACDGWADELGFGEPISSTGALRISSGEAYSNLGQGLAVGEDAAGETWLLVGGGLGGFFPRVLGYTAPVDGVASMEIFGTQDYCYLGSSLAVGDWEAPFVMADQDHSRTGIYWGVGALDFYESLWTVPVDGIYGFATDVETADVDLDGQDELLTGGFGRLYVYSDPTPGTWTDYRLMVQSDPATSEGFGYQVGEIGDLTGDGLPEVTASEENDNVGGRAWIFPGDLTGTVTITDVGWSLVGAEAESHAGFDISVGDVTGDGYADLLTGAYLGNDRAGQGWLVAGPITADGSLADAHASFAPTFGNDFCGRRVEVVPDQDGDGFDEAAIGCARDWYFGVMLPGRVELYSGADAVGEVDALGAARVFVGEGGFDLFGHALAADEDLTGDGMADLVVGAPGDGTVSPSGGAVYLLQSPLL